MWRLGEPHLPRGKQGAIRVSRATKPVHPSMHLPIHSLISKNLLSAKEKPDTFLDAGEATEERDTVITPVWYLAF